MLRGRKEDFNFRQLTVGLVLIVNDKNLDAVKQAFDHELFDNAILTCAEETLK